MSDENHRETDSSAMDMPESVESGGAARRGIARRLAKGLVVVLFALAPLFQTPLGGVLDGALANILTLVCAGVACIILLVWFIFFSNHTRSVRFGVAVVVVLLSLSFNALLRVEEVTGDLVPTFRWRWRPATDELLQKLEATTESGPVDLATTTEFDFPQFLGPNCDCTRLLRGAFPRLVSAAARNWSGSAPSAPGGRPSRLSMVLP